MLGLGRSRCCRGGWRAVGACGSRTVDRPVLDRCGVQIRSSVPRLRTVDRPIRGRLAVGYLTFLVRGPERTLAVAVGRGGLLDVSCARAGQGEAGTDKAVESLPRRRPAAAIGSPPPSYHLARVAQKSTRVSHDLSQRRHKLCPTPPGPKCHKTVPKSAWPDRPARTRAKAARLHCLPGWTVRLCPGVNKGQPTVALARAATRTPCQAQMQAEYLRAQPGRPGDSPRPGPG